MKTLTMKFNPNTGVSVQVLYGPNMTYAPTVAHFRQLFPTLEWGYNPWTGTRRRAVDIDQDPYGKLIVAPDEPLAAASWPQLDNVDPAQASKIIEGFKPVTVDPGKALAPEVRDVLNQPDGHPLYPVFVAAIEQAMFGKGVRHGGALTPFFDQPWHHYAKLHGRGFLTGQAAKKLEEAASGKQGEDFRREVLGAIVYCGMALLHEEQSK